MKLILHIGTEKTGTTSIQKYLYLNRNLLVEKGIYIPLSLGKENHRHVPGYCSQIDKFDEFHKAFNLVTIENKREFKKEFKKKLEKEFTNIPEHIHTVIISSEHFHSRLMLQDEVDEVKNIFFPFFTEMKVIVYLRRQVDLATSLYSTELKSGNVVPEINEFIKERCTSENHYYNYDKFLLLWENTFGIENIEVKIFDKNKFYEKNLILDFSFFAFESQLEDIKNRINFPKIENESITPFGQDFLNYLNGLNETFDNETGRALYNKIMKAIVTLYSGKGKQPSYVVSITAMENFVDTNYTIQKRYFPENKELFSSNLEKCKEELVHTDKNELTIFKFLLDMIRNPFLSQDVDDIRDAALKLEASDIEHSYRLMKIAHNLRPDGIYINDKLKELERLVN